MNDQSQPLARNESDPQAVEEPVVIIVDDDPSVCRALTKLLRTVNLRVETYNSAQAFLDAPLPTAPVCLVLDVRMPGRSGLDLQAELIREGVQIPIIFVTAHGDVPMSVKALKAGAVDFFTKPFGNQELLDAINKALRSANERRQEEGIISGVQAAFDALTVRERQVMTFITSGLINKEVGERLGISEITVKIHRGNVMRKMSATSLPDLVRKAEMLGLQPK